MGGLTRGGFWGGRRGRSWLGSRRGCTSRSVCSIYKCPGQHFATAQLLGMVAMLLLGFEIMTLEGEGIVMPPNAEADERSFGRRGEA